MIADEEFILRLLGLRWYYKSDLCMSKLVDLWLALEKLIYSTGLVIGFTLLDVHMAVFHIHIEDSQLGCKVRSDTYIDRISTIP